MKGGIEKVLIGIHDAEQDYLRKKTFPNYALMKIAAYFKARGDSVEWWEPMNTYDAVLSSKVFDFTPENPYLPQDTIFGGTGYINRTGEYEDLPGEVDAVFPDYSIYPDCDYAIGYLTRGCTNECPWCVVPAKEGYIRPYRRWQDVIRPDSDKIVLMDNNILAIDYGITQLESLIGSGYKIDLNQGMDARLVDEHIADVLARVSWIKYLRFSCDTSAQIDAIHRAAALLDARGVKPYRLFVYMLVTKDLDDAARRADALKRIRGINLYAQAERNDIKGITPNALQTEFAQRYIYGRVYKNESWAEYLKNRQHIRRLRNDL